MAETGSVAGAAKRPARWPFGVSLVATLGIVLISCAMILDLRREVGARARENAGNLLHAVERDIARNIEVLDLSLQGVIEGMSRPDVMAADPTLRNLVLFDRSATAVNLGALVVYDADGILRIDSAGVEPRRIAPVTDRDYFQAQREPGHGLFISRPYESRLIGKPVIGLSRRVSNPDGSFGGVALATIQVSYFSDLMSKLRLGSAGIVSLARDDGAVIVRFSSGSGGVAGRESFGGSPVFQRMRAERAGHFVGVSGVDRVEREYTFTQVTGTPLILSVGMATSDIYGAWADKAVWGGLVLLAICLVVIGLTAVLTRELRRRDLAERRLVLANSELARLSRTDALTELCNRRVFDEVLARETRRSARTGRRASLLLVDVDHFKRFNDRYGHSEGDHTLQAVAKALRGVANRPGDTAFRVGGEEFALLLPETALPGAKVVAERLRQGVRDLAIPHGDAPAGTVTVSIGVAEVDRGDAASIFARADAALYRSKQAGRDRVSVSERWPAAA